MTNSVPLTDYLYTRASQKKMPISGTFELSPVCNFDCRMCYVRKSQQEVDQSERRILNLDDWRAIAKQASENGLLYVLLTGGEPFLWPDFWTLYEELIRMGLLLSINTNGSLIDAQAVARLQKFPPRRVNITLYGASDETYERLCGVKGVFGRVDRAIRALKAAGICVKLNCSLTPDNAEDLEAIVAYAKKQDLLLSVASYMFPPIRKSMDLVGENNRFTPEQAAMHTIRACKLQSSEDEYNRYLDSVMKGSANPPGLDESCIDPVDGRIRCRAGKASFWITWDGWMTPCGMMPEPKVDLTNKGFSESWRELTQVSEALRLSGVCGTCPNQNICHPCAAMAIAETGTSAGIPTYLCKMSREMQRIAVRELEKK